MVDEVLLVLVDVTSALASEVYFFFLEPVILMYPYGDVSGDSLIAYNRYTSRCFKIDIPDFGMLFFGKRHRKVYVSSFVFYTSFVCYFLLSCLPGTNNTA